MLEPQVVRYVLLPSCSSWFIYTWMWDHLVLQPLPHKSSPPRCPSLPLQQVWMNVSSLTPWLSDFHTVQFYGTSGYFVFKLVVVLLLVLQWGTVCLPTPPSWPEVQNHLFCLLFGYPRFNWRWCIVFSCYASLVSFDLKQPLTCFLNSFMTLIFFKYSRPVIFQNSL